jgi:hypothetical protein
VVEINAIVSLLDRGVLRVLYMVQETAVTFGSAAERLGQQQQTILVLWILKRKLDK